MTEPGESESSSDADTKIDTSELETAIGKAEMEEQKASEYTSDSVAKLREALEAARKALKGKSQDEVDAAAKALNEAIKALVPVSAESSTAENTPGTGDAAGTKWFALVMAIALIAAAGSAAAMEIAAKKRKKNNR